MATRAGVPRAGVRSPRRPSAQRSFDDVGEPLAEVTFVVLDLETTGGSPATCSITEVGAVKYRGGEPLGSLQTLVNPGVPIPPEIVYLTGITEAMVLPAPRIADVLGPLVRFIGNAVIVGHNIRFDLGFLAAAMDRHGWPRLDNVAVDTCALARRLVRDEVPNCRLETLARHFRTPRRPTHRALDDAAATADLLHALLERAGAIGVLGLDDLVALPTVAGHPQLSKLKLVSALPRRPGVYLFRDATGAVLYVGKAVDLRRRVRSYFSSDPRRKIARLLVELATIDHHVCSGELEAAVLEVRLIHEHLPRYNRRTKHWQRYAYVKLTLDERFPRLSIVKTPKASDGCLYLGPLPSTAVARLVTEAIQSAVPIRRCTGRPGRVLRESPCGPAQLGVATCPCAGATTEVEYRDIVERLVTGLTTDPSILLAPLARRMRALSDAARFEEAADVRDRAGALARALVRQHRLDALRRAGRLELEVDGESAAIVEDGLLTAAWPANVAGRRPGPRLALPPVTLDDRGHSVAGPVPTHPAPLPRHLADEVSTIAGWLDARAGAVRVVSCDDGWAWPLPRVPTFEATG